MALSFYPEFDPPCSSNPAPFAPPQHNRQIYICLGNGLASAKASPRFVVARPAAAAETRFDPRSARRRALITTRSRAAAARSPPQRAPCLSRFAGECRQRRLPQRQPKAAWLAPRSRKRDPICCGVHRRLTVISGPVHVGPELAQRLNRCHFDNLTCHLIRSKAT